MHRGTSSLLLRLQLLLLCCGVGYAVQYHSLSKVNAERTANGTQEAYLFSNAAVYKDSNKLHVLPFSVLAVVQSRYDILRVHGLFHEFSAKFPKRPYLAMIAVELPRRNHTMDNNVKTNGTEAIEGSMRLKQFLTLLKFKEHASIDLSYLQYEGSLAAEIQHHLFHYMKHMTAIPDAVVTVGHSVTALAASAVGSQFEIPIFQLLSRPVTRSHYATSSPEVREDRIREKIAALYATASLGRHRDSVMIGGGQGGHHAPVGSLLYDSITMGLTLTIAQLTVLNTLLSPGPMDETFNSGGRHYLAVLCSYACSNIISAAHRKQYVNEVTNVARGHSDKMVYLILDDEPPEYTFFNSSLSHYSSAPGARLRSIRSLFRHSMNIAVIEPIADYAIYVNVALKADLIIADCEAAEGFIGEETRAMGARAVLLNTPAGSTVRCPAPSEHTSHLSFVDIYSPTSGDRGPAATTGPSPGRFRSYVATGKDVLLSTVRDLLALRRSPLELGPDMDGMASRRAACLIARHFFAQGLPRYLQSYCKTAAEGRTGAVSEAGEDQEEGVTVVWRGIQSQAELAAQLSSVWAEEDFAAVESFRSSIRHMVFLCPLCNSDLTDDYDIPTLFATSDEEARLSCQRDKGFLTWTCCQSARETLTTHQCSSNRFTIHVVPLPGHDRILELAAIRAAVATPLVIIVDTDSKDTPRVSCTVMTALLQITQQLDVISGPLGFVMGKRHLYIADTAGDELEVDFVQGAWCIRKEWLGELLSGSMEFSRSSREDLPVFVSSVLWSRLGVRTVALAGTGMAQVDGGAIVSAERSLMASRAAVEMGFVPCGLRALQPSYRGSQCCSVLEGGDGAGPAIHGVRSAGADEKCRILYDSLFGSEGESAPDGAEDALETFLIEGGADHNSV